MSQFFVITNCFQIIYLLSHKLQILLFAQNRYKYNGRPINYLLSFVLLIQIDLFKYKHESINCNPNNTNITDI